MMANAFTNLVFYADNINGVRTPLPTDGVLDPGDVGNPDPGGSGGGAGGNTGGGTGGSGGGSSGGDIGNPSGSGVITTGNAPTLTRKTHSQDIYVASSTTMSITYVASAQCSIFPKMGFEDMTVSYSADGLEMTLTWACPVGEAGYSTYIGAECWVYGGDSTEAYSIIWDRVHVNKTAGDIVRSGIGYDTLEIMRGIDAKNMLAGQTCIVSNGNYNREYDLLVVGSSSVWAGGNYLSNIPNGVYTSSTYSEIIAGQEVGFTRRTVSKFTCIMAETPCGVVIDRQNRSLGLVMAGRAEWSVTNGGLDGRRDCIGITMLGFDARHMSWNPSYLTRTENCAFIACSVLQDTNRNIPIPNIPNQFWRGAGSGLSTTACIQSQYEYCHVMTNERMHLNAGSGFNYKARKSGFKKIIMQQGCVDGGDQDITKSASFYGCIQEDCFNVLSSDFFEFYQGCRSNTHLSPVSMRLNFEFSANNGVNDAVRWYGCMSLNSIRGMFDATDAGRTLGIKDLMQNCVGWKSLRLTGATIPPDVMIANGAFEITNVTIGYREGLQGNYNTLNPYNQPLEVQSVINSLLIASPSWDFAEASSNTVFAGGTTKYSSISKLGIINKPPATNMALPNYAANYYEYPLSQTRQAGFWYISRTEEGSPLRLNDVGCHNYFATKSRIMKFRLDSGYDTVYESVNWMSRSPWQAFRAANQAYSCTLSHDPSRTFTGGKGWAQAGCNPVDYILRHGTSPAHPINTPYLEDIYGYVHSGSVTIKWRPICPLYRSTIVGYDFFIDGVKVASNQDKRLTQFTFAGINSGTRKFNIVVKDSLYGDSGFSKSVILTI